VEAERWEAAERSYWTGVHQRTNLAFFSGGKRFANVSITSPHMSYISTTTEQSRDFKHLQGLETLTYHFQELIEWLTL
jgi:hypothetical protein